MYLTLSLQSDSQVCEIKNSVTPFMKLKEVELPYEFDEFGPEVLVS